MKTSVWQIMARILITVMTLGAVVMLSICLIVNIIEGKNLLAVDASAMKELPLVETAWKMLTPVSFLIVLLGFTVWPSLSFMTPVGAYCVVMMFVLGNLFLSRYLTKFKGTRTAIAVNLGLILLDLPFALVNYIPGAGYGWIRSGIITVISLLVHLSAAFVLIMALRYTVKNEMWFSDLFPSPRAEHIRSYNSEMREGMTDKEIKAVWNRLVFPWIARVLTILVAGGTLVTLIAMLTVDVTDYDGISVWLTFVLIVNSILCWFFGGIGISGDLLLQIGMGLCMLIFVAALYFLQRFFTRDSRLTKPALVFTLTVAVIDILPFFSIAGIIAFINAIIHILWIVMLALSLRKVCKKEKKTPDCLTEPEAGENNAEIPPADIQE